MIRRCLGVAMATAWLVVVAPPFGDAVSWTSSASGTFQTRVGQFCIIAASVEVELDEKEFVAAEIAFPSGVRPGPSIERIEVATVSLQVEGSARAIHALLRPSPIEDEDGIRVREVNFGRTGVLALLDGRTGIVRLIVSGTVNGCRFSGSDTIGLEDPPPACGWRDRICSRVSVDGRRKVNPWSVWTYIRQSKIVV